MFKHLIRAISVLLICCLVFDTGYAAAFAQLGHPVARMTESPVPVFTQQALAAIPLDGSWMRILHHVPNPTRLLQFSRTQGGGRVVGKRMLIGISIDGFTSRFLRSAPAEYTDESGDVKKLIEEGVERYYSTHPKPFWHETSFALMDTAGHPSAARAYKKPGFFTAQVVLDKAEMETLAHYYIHGTKDEHDAARWLIDFRLNHELSHSNWPTGGPYFAFGLLLMAVFAALVTIYQHSPHFATLAIPFGYGISAGFLIMSAGGLRMRRDEREEGRLILWDSIRQHELFRESKIDYWHVRQLLEKESSLSGLKAYFMTFEQVGHPSTAEQGRKSWDDFFARTDVARWWPGVRTTPTPLEDNLGPELIQAQEDSILVLRFLALAQRLHFIDGPDVIDTTETFSATPRWNEITEWISHRRPGQPARIVSFTFDDPITWYVASVDDQVIQVFAKEMSAISRLYLQEVDPQTWALDESEGLRDIFRGRTAGLAQYLREHKIVEKMEQWSVDPEYRDIAWFHTGAAHHLFDRPHHAFSSLEEVPPKIMRGDVDEAALLMRGARHRLQRIEKDMQARFASLREALDRYLGLAQSDPNRLVREVREVYGVESKGDHSALVKLLGFKSSALFYIANNPRDFSHVVPEKAGEDGLRLRIYVQPEQQPPWRLVLHVQIQKWNAAQQEIVYEGINFEVINLDTGRSAVGPIYYEAPDSEEAVMPYLGNGRYFLRLFEGTSDYQKALAELKEGGPRRQKTLEESMEDLTEDSEEPEILSNLPPRAVHETIAQQQLLENIRFVLEKKNLPLHLPAETLRDYVSSRGPLSLASLSYLLEENKADPARALELQQALHEVRYIRVLQAEDPEKFGYADEVLPSWVYPYVEELQSPRWEWHARPSVAEQYRSLFIHHLLSQEPMKKKDRWQIMKMRRLITRRAATFEMRYRLKQGELTLVDVKKRPVHHLYLDVRGYNALKRLNCQTIGDVVTKRWREVSRTQNANKITTAKINNALQAIDPTLHLISDETSSDDALRELGQASPVGISPEVLDHPIVIEEWSIRIFHRFERLGIRTVGQLAQWSFRSLRTGNYLGRPSLEEIRTFLAKYGIRLYGDSLAYPPLRLVHTQLDTPLRAISLSAWRICAAAGIETYGQLLALTEDQMRALPKMTPAIADHLVSVVKERGGQFKNSELPGESRNTMPGKTRRFGNPGPAVLDYPRIMEYAEIKNLLDQGRVVYGVPSRMAHEFDKSIPADSGKDYSIRRGPGGKLDFTINSEDEFLRIYDLGWEGRLKHRQQWGKPLATEKHQRLEKALAEAIQAHKKTLRGISPEAVDALLFPHLGGTKIEVRGSHDHFGEAHIDGLKNTILVDKDLLKAENYDLLVATLIDEIGHVITREGDAKNTPNSIRVYAMHLFDQWNKNVDRVIVKMEQLFKTLNMTNNEIYAGFSEPLRFSLRHLPFPISMDSRYAFAVALEELSNHVAKRILEIRGEAKMPQTGADRWTMPSGPTSDMPPGALEDWQWREVQSDENYAIFTVTSQEKTPKTFTIISGSDPGEAALYEAIISARRGTGIKTLKMHDLPLLFQTLIGKVPGSVTILMQQELDAYYKILEQRLAVSTLPNLDLFGRTVFPSQTKVIDDLIRNRTLSRDDAVLAFLVERLGTGASNFTQGINPGNEKQSWDHFLQSMARGIAAAYHIPIPVSEFERVAKERLGDPSKVDEAIAQGNQILRMSYGLMLDETRRKINEILQADPDLSPDLVLVRISPHYLPAFHQKMFQNRVRDFTADAQTVKKNLRVFNILEDSGITGNGGQIVMGWAIAMVGAALWRLYAAGTTVFAAGVTATASHLPHVLKPFEGGLWFLDIDGTYQLMMGAGLVLLVLGLIQMKGAWPQKRGANETDDERVVRRKRQKSFESGALASTTGALVGLIGLMSSMTEQIEKLPEHPVVPPTPIAPLMTLAFIMNFVAMIGMSFLVIGLKLARELFGHLVAEAETTNKTWRGVFKRLIQQMWEFAYRGESTGGLIQLADQVADGTETMANAVDLVHGDPEAITFIRIYGEYHRRTKIGFGIVVATVFGVGVGLYGAMTGMALQGVDETTAFIKSLITGLGLLTIWTLAEPRPLHMIRNKWLRLGIGAIIALALAQWWFGILHMPSTSHAALYFMPVAMAVLGGAFSSPGQKNSTLQAA